jgi:hypothetical protein
MASTLPRWLNESLLHTRNASLANERSINATPADADPEPAEPPNLLRLLTVGEESIFSASSDGGNGNSAQLWSPADDSFTTGDALAQRVHAEGVVADERGAEEARQLVADDAVAAGGPLGAKEPAPGPAKLSLALFLANEALQVALGEMRGKERLNR